MCDFKCIYNKNQTSFTDLIIYDYDNIKKSNLRSLLQSNPDNFFPPQFKRKCFV